jgi:hypothetical protein
MSSIKNDKIGRMQFQFVHPVPFNFLDGVEQAMHKNAGRVIKLSDASKEFGVETGTLSRWAACGLIPIIRKEEKFTFIDVERLAGMAIWHKRFGRRAARLFRPNDLNQVYLSASTPDAMKDIVEFINSKNGVVSGGGLDVGMAQQSAGSG